MRHGKKFNHLKRKSAHRKATLRSLSHALIEHKRINTTLAKAKALRVFVEPILTKSKTNTTHSRRVVFRHLGNKYAVAELFDNIAEKIANRPGGYVRIIKTGFRKGDGAEMAMIELVDYNDIMVSASQSSQRSDAGSGGKKTRRSRRGKGAGAAAAAPAVGNSEEE